jgi:hypothetical protein
MEYLLWQFDSKSPGLLETSQAVAAFERRTGRPATLVLVRTGATVVVPAGVTVDLVDFVAPGTCRVINDEKK